jgi:outer membrane protein assembly factor BamE (lipoprotein component of BamABCDE complex)
MKAICIFLAAISLLFAGCASDPHDAYSTALAGMSRNNLRFYFGEPLRIQSTPGGGEDWYYRFNTWKSQPTGASGNNNDFGQQSSYASAGLQFSQDTEERPVHVSADGFVVGPVPKGKIVKN